MPLYEGRVVTHIVFDAADTQEARKTLQRIKQASAHGVPGLVLSSTSEFTGVPTSLSLDALACELCQREIKKGDTHKHGINICARVEALIGGQTATEEFMQRFQPGQS